MFFAESLDTFLQDLQRARPTLFISVPRLWLKFQQGVFAKMPPAKLDRLLGIPILGRIVAKKVLKGLGLDAVRQAGSGSAPLPAELIRWYRRLGLKLFEGYGMTEDNSYSHSSNEQFNEPGYVGVAQPGVQVRISPEGEIQIKSPGQFSGYYKQPELTAAVLHRGRLLPHRRPRRAARRRPAEDHRPHQGAVQDGQGQVRGAGADREPAAMPTRWSSWRWSRASASRRPMRWWCWPRTCGRGCGDAGVRARGASSELGALLKQVNRRVADYERLQMIVVAREPWTIENGCLTPTMKIKRSRIEGARSRRRSDGWYAAARARWSGPEPAGRQVEHG